MTGISNRLNLRAVVSQITWISNRLTHKNMTTKSLESQSKEISNQMIEPEINWQLNSIESQISWQPNQLNLRWIDWQPNHLKLKSIESHVNWNSKQLNLKSIDFRNILSNWIPHLLPIRSLSLETSATAPCTRYVSDGWKKHLKQTIGFMMLRLVTHFVLIFKSGVITFFFLARLKSLQLEEWLGYYMACNVFCTDQVTTITGATNLLFMNS